MLVAGVLVRHLTSFEASAAMLVWVATGRGSGRHLLLGAGGPLFGPVLKARLREHHRAILAEQAGR